MSKKKKVIIEEIWGEIFRISSMWIIRVPEEKAGKRRGNK